MPLLEELTQQHGNDGLKVFMINLKEDRAMVSAFIKARNYSSTVLLDTQGEVAKKFHIMGIPASLVIDKSGKTAFRSSGSVDWKSGKMRSILTSLLDEQSEGA